MAGTASSDSSPSRPRTRARWIVTVVVIVVVAPVLWIAVRAFIAYDALVNAESDVSSVQSAISTNDLQALPYIYDDMRADTASAASINSDPIWKAAQHLPVVGPNLTAFSQVTVTVNDLVVKGIGPLAKAAKGFTLADVLPRHGHVDLARIEALVPAINDAYRGIRESATVAGSIDTSHTLGPVTRAVGTLQGLVQKAQADIKGARSALALVPDALGSNGPRNYLVLLGNNSMDRSNGGVAAVAALITINNGNLTVVRTVPAASIGMGVSATRSKLPPVSETGGLGGPLDQRTPNFPDTAAPAADEWTATYHDRVDGVLSLDTVGLGYLATATGATPVLYHRNPSTATLEPSRTLFASSPDSPKLAAQQQQALDQVLGNVIAGRGPSAGYLSAAGSLFNEKRLFVWSAIPAEQKLLASTPLAGVLPDNNSKVTTYGVFFNDPGSAPTSPELTTTIELQRQSCFAAGNSSRLTVTLVSARSTGTIDEDLLVYGPVGFRYSTFKVKGGTATLRRLASSGARPVDEFTVTVPPKGTVTLVIDHSSANAPASNVVEVRTTPRWQVTQLNLPLCG